MGNVLRLLIVVPLAFVVAVVTATMVLLARDMGTAHDPFEMGFLIGHAIGLVNWVGSIAFFPMLVAIFVAELFSIRSIVYWLTVGGLIGFIPRILATPAAGDGYLDAATTQMLAAGFAGALIYWLIAGRRSGGRMPDDTPRRY